MGCAAVFPHTIYKMRTVIRSPHYPRLQQVS